MVERLDVVAGPTGRRRWSDEVKAGIVAESFDPAVSVSAVARRHGLRPGQLFAWRRQAREGRLALPFDEAGVGFAPVLIGRDGETPWGSTARREAMGSAAPGEARIEIETGGMVVRLPPAMPAGRLAEIVAALRSVS